MHAIFSRSASAKRSKTGSFPPREVGTLRQSHSSSAVHERMKSRSLPVVSRILRWVFTLGTLFVALPLLLVLLDEINHSEKGYAENLRPFSLKESLFAPLSDRYLHKRTASYLLSRNVTIKRSIDDVFNAIMSPQLWVTCYPETVAVGSITSRPMRKGDLVLEKFLFNGMFYSTFRYEVELLDRPTAGRFHGILMHSNAVAEWLFGRLLKDLGGTFDYKFHAIDSNTTMWTRDLHLYTTSQSFAGMVFYRLVLAVLRGSQEKGATLFVECTKHLLELPFEEHQRELFGK